MMALLMRIGLAVTVAFIFLLISSAPGLVLGGRPTRLQGPREGVATTEPGISEVLLRGYYSGSTGIAELGSPGHIDLGFSGRRMLAAVEVGRPVAARVPGNDEAPLEQQLGAQATSSFQTVDLTPPARPPPTPTPFSSRFAFLFRSLAKGGPPPSTGTPSPGHN